MTQFQFLPVGSYFVLTGTVPGDFIMLYLKVSDTEAMNLLCKIQMNIQPNTTVYRIYL